jgi:DNA-binding NarL/FixJ family response regulator
VVLTTSSSEEDILSSYQLHANAYVTKPVDFAAFVEVVQQIDEFFIGVVELPPRPPRTGRRPAVSSAHHRRSAPRLRPPRQRWRPHRRV